MPAIQSTTLVLYDATRPDAVKNPGKYQWVLNENILGGRTNKIRLHLRYMTLMYNWYTFNNEVITYNDGAPKTITLNGNYTTSSFLVYLNTQLGAGYIATISDVTGKLIIAVPAPVTFTVATLKWSKRLKYFLGSGQSNIASVAGIVTFPFPVKLGGDQLIQVKMQGIIGNDTNGALTTGIDADALHIPIKYNPFYQITLQPENFYTIITTTENSSATFEITFLDQFGDELDLNDGDALFQFDLE